MTFPSIGDGLMQLVSSSHIFLKQKNNVNITVEGEWQASLLSPVQADTLLMLIHVLIEVS